VKLIWRVIFTIRAILANAVFVPFTGFMSIVVLFLAASGKISRFEAAARFWARTCLRLYGVRVEVHGLEHVVLDRGVLFLFNHQSHFDILCLYSHMPKRMRFGAKIELFKIPFFGRAMRAVGTLPIARSDRSETFRIYREAESRFSENMSFALAPEGTRQAQPVIGPFKKGPFIFAQNAHAVIQPVVIRGAHEVLPKGSLLPNRNQRERLIHMRFLPAVDTRSYPDSKPGLEKLIDDVREQTCVAYSEMQALPLIPQ